MVAILDICSDVEFYNLILADFFIFATFYLANYLAKVFLQIEYMI